MFSEATQIRLVRTAVELYVRGEVEGDKEAREVTQAAADWLLNHLMQERVAYLKGEID